MITLTNMLAATHQGFFYPVQASKIAGDIDPLAWFIHGITIFFTVLIFAVTIYFAIRYRASVHPVPEPPGHNNVLEVAWTALPAVIVFICFFWGFRVYMRMTVTQPGVEQIEAVGATWFWQFQYRNPQSGGNVPDPTLYLPLNTPVEIRLSSNDVLHALFLPAMRVKKDVVPGRFNQMYVEATMEGTFDVYCAEYCGDSHSEMRAKAVVLPYDQWKAKIIEISDPLRDKDKVPAQDVGKRIVGLNGCASCHSSDGSSNTGPTWKDLYGATGHQMADGSAVTVDDNYVLESIRNPNAKVRKGFGPPSAMNPYTPNQIPDEHVKYIIAYMKSVSANAPKEAATTQVGSPTPPGAPAVPPTSNPAMAPH